MYNKFWIVDGCVVIVGGCNIGEEYFSVCIDVNFCDLDLFVVGKVVQQVNMIFDDYWNSEIVFFIVVLVFYILVQLCLLVCQFEYEVWLDGVKCYLVCVVCLQQVQLYYCDVVDLYWICQVVIVFDLLMKYCCDDWGDWLVVWFLVELVGICYKVLLIFLYFVFGEEGMQGLGVLVVCGVIVGVVINLLVVNDVVVVYSGYMYYCVLLLCSGVYLYELKLCGYVDSGGLFGSSGVSLYIKVFMIDDWCGFVGLFNFDLCLVYFNIEMGVLFDDLVLVV